MFIHSGEDRAFIHNLRIAALLAAVAGSVNVIGLLYTGTLTTNITGHFAVFMQDLLLGKYIYGLYFLSFIIAFLVGSITSNLLIEKFTETSNKFRFLRPVILEVALFAAVVLLYLIQPELNKLIVANILLFAMGLQNAMVTKISGAIVRTTHLTGIFTDLGIELSQLLTGKSKDKEEHLIRNIQLRFRIILFFFIGGVSGGIVFRYINLYALILPITLLLGGILFDLLQSRKTSSS